MVMLVLYKVNPFNFPLKLYPSKSSNIDIKKHGLRHMKNKFKYPNYQLNDLKLKIQLNI